MLPFSFNANVFNEIGTFRIVDKVYYDNEKQQWVAKLSEPIEGTISAQGMRKIVPFTVFMCFPESADLCPVWPTGPVYLERGTFYKNSKFQYRNGIRTQIQRISHGCIK